MLYLPEQLLKFTAGRNRNDVVDMYHAEYRVCYSVYCQLQTGSASEISFLQQQLELERQGLHQLAAWNRKYRHDLQHREASRNVQTITQRPLAALRQWQQEKADE